MLVLSWLICAVLLGGCSAPADPEADHERPAGVSVADHWAYLLEIDDPLERTVAMSEFMRTLGPEDAPVIGELASNLFRRHRALDDMILMNTWVRLDPEKAIEAALRAQSPIAEGMRVDVVRYWASQNPQAAVTALSAKESAVERSLIMGWYESALPGLEEFVLRNEASRTGQHMLATYAAEIRHEKGAEGLAAWIDSVRERRDLEPIMITHVHRKGLSEMAVADPEAAIAYCDIHCDAPYADSSRSRLADRMGLLGQGERAVRWLETSTEAPQEERGRAARIAFRAWLRKDREAAMSWADASLDKYANDEWFLPLARMAITVHTRRQPPAAIPWVRVYPDEQDREDALIRIGRRWRELDEAAAEAWIEESPLDAEGRAKARMPEAYRNRQKNPDA